MAPLHHLQLRSHIHSLNQPNRRTKYAHAQVPTPDPVERVGLSRGSHLQRPEVPVDVPDVRRDRRLRRFGLPPFPRLLGLCLCLHARRRPRPRLRRPRRRAMIRVRSGGRGDLSQGLALPARPIERRRRVRGVLLAIHRLRVRLRPPPPDPHAAADGRDGRADSFLRLPWLSAGVCRVWFGSGDE